MKLPLPTGKQPSGAIQAIFSPGAGTRLECLALTRAIEYFAMLKGLGAAKFNAKFAGGIEISTAPSGSWLVDREINTNELPSLARAISFPGIGYISRTLRTTRPECQVASGKGKMLFSWVAACTAVSAWPHYRSTI